MSKTHIEPLLFDPRRPKLTPERCLYEASVWETRRTTARFPSFIKTCEEQARAWFNHALELEMEKKDGEEG